MLVEGVQNVEAMAVAYADDVAILIGRKLLQALGELMESALDRPCFVLI